MFERASGSDAMFKQKIYSHVLSSIRVDDRYPIYFDKDDHEPEHKNYLIKHIMDEYIRIKCTSIAKMETINMQKRYLRNKYRKIIHFKGQ